MNVDIVTTVTSTLTFPEDGGQPTVEHKLEVQVPEEVQGIIAVGAALGGLRSGVAAIETEYGLNQRGGDDE